jgi:outer membrane protein assembly factor BamB
MNYRRVFVYSFLVLSLLCGSQVWGAAGDPLWEKEFNVPSYPTITINAMSVSQTSVIMCGNASGAGTSPQQIGFIRALDVTTGNLKWEHYLNLGSQTNNFSVINIEGGIVLILGTAYGWVQNPPSQLSKSIVRACYADTGQLLWETQKDIYTTTQTFPTTSYPPIMATGNNRTFLALLAPGGPGPGNCIVRAFQVKNVGIEPTMLLLD